MWSLGGGVRGIPDDALQVRLSGHHLLAHLPGQRARGDRCHRHLRLLPGSAGRHEGEPLHAHHCEWEETWRLLSEWAEFTEWPNETLQKTT